MGGNTRDGSTPFSRIDQVVLRQAGDTQACLARRLAQIAVPGDDDRLPVKLQGSREVHGVIAAQAVFLGKRASAVGKLRVYAERNHPALQIPEIGNGAPMSLPAKATCAFSGRQRRPSLWIGEDARGHRGGAVPEFGRRVGVILDDDELDERRSVEVEDQRRCSATKSDTEPAAFTRACRRVRGFSGMRTRPRRVRSSSGSEPNR